MLHLTVWVRLFSIAELLSTELNCISPSAMVPTVSDALEALSSLTDELGEMLKQIANITAELSASDLIRVEDVQQVKLLSIWLIYGPLTRL
jgi:hypothetical protein